nr:hypothetical protein BaRGS_000967 [Batillaria attramentaria]
MERNPHYDYFPLYSCRTWLAINVSIWILITLTKLTVAVVVLTEVMQLRRWRRIGSKMQKMATGVMAMVAVTYSLVIIPTVFFLVSIRKRSCLYIDYIEVKVSDLPQNALSIVSYLIPSLAIVISLFLLRLLYVSKSPPASAPEPGGVTTTARAVGMRALNRLVVVVVIMTEVMQLQRVVRIRVKAQMAVTLGMLVMALVYDKY